MTIFTSFFLAVLVANLNLPALIQNKTTRLRLFPWTWSVLPNPDRERTNQSAQIYLRLVLPYNKTHYLWHVMLHRRIFLRIFRVKAIMSDVKKKIRISGGVWVFNEVWGARERLISPCKSRWRWCRTEAEILALDFAKSNLISFSMVGHSRYSQITSRCPENLRHSTFIRL